MMYRENSKITNMHLAKKAILYIRQSTMRQVYENNESTVRQYALKEKLIALGWPLDQIIVIDQDLGKSGADAKGRDGFQTLVSEVSNNLVGAVACIECSRLSRSSADFRSLTQFCAYTNTLLIDADGIYDPTDFNDKLLLGIKGSISEAELHFLQERMLGGLMNKAKRGELKRPIPIGYLYDGDRIIKDPDIEIQNAVEMLFEAFRRTGAAHSVVMYFKTKGYKFPYRIGKGFRRGEVEWMDLKLAHVLDILHNPFYAGVYFYGESQRVWTPNGKKSKKMPREEWHVFLKDHHVTYIPYEEFEANENILSENFTRRKSEEKRTPPREGTALLQGLVWCGKCGRRMTVRYTQRGDQLLPNYICVKDSVENGGDVCQSLIGHAIDKSVADLLIKRLTPEVIAQSVAIEKELESRRDETLNYYRMRVEKCSYEAGLARKRFMNVDPDNRLVALELESSWNIKLKDLDEARNEYDDQAEKMERTRINRDYSLVDNLDGNFAELFRSDSVSSKDKKRMARYLIEDITLKRVELGVQIQIRYKCNTTQTLIIDAPKRSYEGWTTHPDIIETINEAAENLIVEEIADLLNKKGFITGKGHKFTANLVKRVMYSYDIPNKKERYLNRGYVISSVKAASLGISPSGLLLRIRKGKYKGEHIQVNSREYVFPPGQDCGVENA